MKIDNIKEHIETFIKMHSSTLLNKERVSLVDALSKWVYDIVDTKEKSLQCCGNCKRYEHGMCVKAGRDMKCSDSCVEWKGL
jgi:hypothetical protein